MASRLEGLKLGDRLTRWLAQPEHAARVARQVADCLPPLLRALDNDTVRHFLRDRIIGRLRRFEAAPLAGQALELLIAEGRHRPLVDAVLREQEPEIRERVRTHTAWLWQKLSLDERISDRIVAGAEDTLLEISADPDHPWRQRLDRSVAQFATDLCESAAYREQGEVIKERLLLPPLLQDYLAGLWGEISQGLQDDLAGADSAIRSRSLEIFRLLAEGLARDEALRAQLDAWLREAIVATVSAQRHQVAELIASTVRQWDGDTMAQKIEGQIGADLQFIRINGTVIGGLAGLVLHAVTLLAF